MFAHHIVAKGFLCFEASRTVHEVTAFVASGDGDRFSPETLHWSDQIALRKVLKILDSSRAMQTVSRLWEFLNSETKQI